MLIFAAPSKKKFVNDEKIVSNLHRLDTIILFVQEAHDLALQYYVSSRC